MRSPELSSGKLDAIRLLKILSKWHRQLISIAVAAVAISFVFTLPVFMKPVYKASAIVYPINLQPYSKETPTEQLVQLFNSEDVKFKLVSAFDLYKHYDIDPKSKFPRFEMLSRLDENIKVDKTEFESIEINSYDENPETAARICDSLIHFVDEKALDLVRQRADEVSIITKKQLDEKKAEMDSMETAIRELRQNYGILDFENQVLGFSREYYHYLGSGGVNARLEQDRKNLEEKGGEYTSLKEHLWRVRGTYNDYKLKYEQSVTDLHKSLTFHNFVTEPVTPEKKDSPKRALIMLLFTISVLAVSALVIVYQEHFREKLNAQLND